MHNYTRQVFKSLSSKEKRAYIDRLINSYVDLNKEELKAASKDQIKRYFDNKFNTRRTFEPEELQYLSFDQIKQFLAKNNNIYSGDGKTNVPTLITYLVTEAVVLEKNE